MSHVFISYARDDQAVAGELADALQKMGWSVWWDHRIPAGADFHADIEKALTDARCVIVLWSRRSIASQFVRDEATDGKDRGVLVPVRIDEVQPPLGFRQTQTVDLLDWAGDHQSAGFKQIVEAVERLSTVAPTAEPVFEQRRATQRWRRLGVAGLIMAGISLAAVFQLTRNGQSDMVSLPGGDFMMGSTESEAISALGPAHPATWSEREQPRHRVKLDAFHIDRFEVTVAQFQKFIDGQAQEQPPRASLDAPDSHPVTGVTWSEAIRFCAWAGKVLPSEAQWEYAARGGAEREFPWGSAPVSVLRANFCDRQCEGSSSRQDDGFKDTAPVGSFPDGNSPQGVHDLAGNVAEWVRDAYSARFYGRRDKTNPVNEELGNDGYRVVRGGSYADEPYFLRAATRNFRPEDTRSPKIGFRCAQPAS